MSKLATAGAVLVAVLAVFIGIDHAPHIFNEDDLHAIANKSLVLKDKHAMFANMTRALKDKYGDHIDTDLPWMFVNCGTFMGTFKLVHASLSEYVLLFGTPIGTSGHSGRYWGDIIDFMVMGEYWQYEEGSVDMNVYRAGDKIVHWRWDATGVRFHNETWMLEYGRGVVPSFLPFALADSLVSNQDFITIYKYFKYYGKLVIKELLMGKI